jgi:hypothetical protein
MPRTANERRAKEGKKSGAGKIYIEMPINIQQQRRKVLARNSSSCHVKIFSRSS